MWGLHTGSIRTKLLRRSPCNVLTQNRQLPPAERGSFSGLHFSCPSQWRNSSGNMRFYLWCLQTIRQQHFRCLRSLSCVPTNAAYFSLVWPLSASFQPLVSLLMTFICSLNHSRVLQAGRERRWREIWRRIWNSSENSQARRRAKANTSYSSVCSMI